ncbi:MAG: GNAT family N-acetyltransferase [Bacteroidales bacterium]|nr:GNAT family N-acetyltransferase [Bacteroidales bacterium]MDT8429931.1 GNAT family N-acetyltransferase [Bacteroidales bacterium]
MNEAAHITKNLFTFYSEVSRLGELESGIIGGIPWIGRPSGGWPGYLLGGGAPGAGQVKQIAASMAQGSVPAFWILESDGSGATEKLLSSHGIRMINYWTGMYLEGRDMQMNVQPAPECDIRKISGENELDLWLGLVNRVIMTSTSLHPALFRKLLPDKNFHFYGLWKNDELLSATLIFVHDQTAGLYFVATDALQQGRGYGTAIFDYAMKELKTAGAERLVLHATRQGMKLYHRAGFREVNRYDIYWLLGKR